jgi:hypothetical protein
MQNNKKTGTQNATIVQDDAKIVQTCLKWHILDDFTSEFRRYFYWVW